MQSYYQSKTILRFLHSPLKRTEEGKHTNTQVLPFKEWYDSSQKKASNKTTAYFTCKRFWSSKLLHSFYYSHYLCNITAICRT